MKRFGYSLFSRAYHLKTPLKKITLVTTAFLTVNFFFDTRKKFFAKETQNDSLFIHTFASIQDALREVKYSGADKFPSLVVIGDQSSGKSSILESIVGVPFVPKGEGTVTKRPLIITLHKQENSKVVAHFPKLGIRTEDFKKVEEVIRSNNQKFTAEPLYLDIYSPNVVDLRLVDLPGLIHNPRKDQPSNLRQIITDICHPFVEPENSIIIAVSAGNTDIQTSESMSYARKYDPQGQRTISVITKLDLLPSDSMKEFINTIDKLPTNQGFIGVKCRSKREVETGVSLEEARENERDFFLSNPLFSTSEAFSTTCDYLVKKLNNVLEEKIHDQLYVIVNQLNTDLRLYKEELQKLGGAPKTSSDKDREKEIIKLTKNYIDQVFDNGIMEEIKRELAKTIFLKVMDHCDEILYNSDKSKLIGTTPVKDDEINWWWTRSESEEYSIWLNHVSNILQDTKPIGDEAISKMNDQLKHRINSGYKIVDDYPRLAEIIKMTCHDHLNNSYTHLLDTVQFLISLEKNVRPDELTIKEQIPRVRARRYKRAQEINAELGKSDTSKEEKERLKKQLELISGSSILGVWNKDREMKRYDDIYTEGYLLEVAVRLSNNIFNAVCVEMLNELKSNLQIEVTQVVVQKLKKEDLLMQSPVITSKRKTLADKITTLHSSLDKIQKLIDMQK